MTAAANSSLLGFLSSGEAVGYQIKRSLRFNSSDSAFLSRNFTTPTANTQWTFSCWVKRVSTPAVSDVLFSANYSYGLDARISFLSDNTFYYSDGGGPGGALQTTAVYRDFSAWQHVVFVYDSPNVTSSDRLRLYINGIRITSSNGLGTTTYPSQNTASNFNAAKVHKIGEFATVAGYYANFYLADIHFIDGQTLTPSSFAETNATTGQWVPKAYTGTYGTNGFKLNFADNSAATAAALGKDTSGNNNNWSPTNFQVSNTPYANYATGGTNPKEVFDGIADLNNRNFLTGTQVFEFAYTPGLAYSSKIEIWAYTGNGTDGATAYQINNSGSYTNFSADGTWGWLTVATGSGTLTNLKYRGNSNNSGLSFIAAIRIDSTTILIDDASRIDSLVDTPTSYGTGNSGGDVRGNFCTANPLKTNSGVGFSNGNLDLDATTGGWFSCYSTFGITSGKWYWEATMTTNTSSALNAIALGICPDDTNILSNYVGATSDSYGLFSNGNKVNSASQVSYGSSFSAGDIAMVAFDDDSGKIWFGKNGTWFASGDPAAGTNAAYTSISATKTWIPVFSFDRGRFYCNFGQRPFAYTAPSGFKALCDTNLPAPVIAKPNSVFDVALWTGNGSARSITGLNFNPDFVWIKGRSGATDHALYDAVRGATIDLVSNSTAAETTQTQGLTAFNSDGFSLGTLAKVNTNTATYAGWAWDAGSSTVTNTQGSITSQVRANASAGFSIVTYTGTGTTATVGHGLGVAPSLIICKQRSGTSAWAVYHKSTGRNGFLLLNASDAFTSLTGYWGASDPSSTVISYDNGGYGGNNSNGSTYVAYCFAPVAGYSAFGSYTGNGSADGPFVFTGFRPRFLMYKSSTAAEMWAILDAARPGHNAINQYLFPNSSAAEGSAVVVADFLSNGFKIRYNTADVNTSGGVYIYAAFAENPFQFSRAR